MTREPGPTSAAFRLGELTAEVRELIHSHRDEAQVTRASFEKLDKRLEKIEGRVDGYDRLRNRGAGIFVGIALAFSGAGILLSSWVKDAIKAIF